MRLVSVAVLLSAALASLALGDSSANVTGRYRSNWDEVRLHQRGSHVTGTYVCCGGGTIDGVIEGRVLHYRWHEPHGAGDGHGTWTISGDTLDGTWGFGDSESNGGPWTLQRTGAQIAQ